MNLLYVYAHPNPESLNHVLKQYAAETLTASGIKLSNSDLYTEKFNAVASWHDFEDPIPQPQYMLAQQESYLDGSLSPDIKTELEKIADADHIILQFPLWWFSTPAILKGWMDRVFVKGFAYDAGKIFDNGLLKGKTASLTVTTQSPESAYQLDGVHRSGIESFLQHIHHTLRFTGMKTLAPFVVYGASEMSAGRLAQIKEEYANYLRSNVIA